MNLSFRLAAAILLAATASFPQQPQPSPKRPLDVADFAALRDVADPRLSPDGQWVAYTVKQASFDDDKNHKHIWLSTFDGKTSFQLTLSKESESAPKWSPDGRFIAFISSRGADDEIDQLWLINRQGGEGERITEFKGSVVDYDWAPDGKSLVLAVEDPDPSEAGADKDKKKTKPPIVINRFQFKQDIAGYLTTKRQHLYLLDLATRKSASLTAGGFGEFLPSFSPDGTRVAYVSKSGDDPDRANNWDLFIIDAKAGATPKQLTTWRGADDDPDWEARPAWSPDGKSIAYIQGGDPALIDYAVRHLAMIPSTGGEPKVLTAALDRKVGRPRFSADGASILFLVEDDRTQMLARIPSGGGKIETLLGGKREVTTFDVAHDHIAALVSDLLTPPEVFAAEGGAARAITHCNRDFLAQISLGAAEEIDYPSKDGTVIHGFVVLPPVFERGKQYPAVLRIHGGPVSQFPYRFSFEWQLLAAKGYIVIGVNPRGSSGRGQEFSRAIWADWGHKDAEDVLAAVDAVVKRGIADPNRLGVGGWSYGGILTNYVIAQDRRFKAATSGASMSNLLAGYGTDEYVRDYELELGRPWEHPEVWMRLSFPFLHADRIKTPTLFLAGDKDFNVPLLNSEQMYQALRSLGMPTQLIIYPSQFHGLTKPSYVKDRYERYLGWYAQYLK